MQIHFGYTLILKVFADLGNLFGDVQIGINLYAIFQIIVMDLVISYYIYWLYKKGYSIFTLVLTICFFGFFKLIPHYAISLWKDTAFSVMLFLYTIFVADIILSNGKKMNRWLFLIIFNIICIFVAFLRLNGKYVVILTNIILILLYRKNILKKSKIITLLTLVIIYIIQGPIFNYLKLNPNGGGILSTPMQQILYVRVTDGKITEEQKELLDYIMPLDEMKKTFSPFLLDNTANNPFYNKEHVREKTSDLWKLWIELAIQNPKKYVEEFLLNTMGFWDVNKILSDQYVSDIMWPEPVFGLQYKQYNLVKGPIGVVLKNIVGINKLYSGGIFFGIMLLSILFTLHQREYNRLLIYLPSVLLWLSVMVGTPIAFALRYVYILVLMVPFDFIIPFLKDNENAITNNKK